jgi:hypothetical protein
MDFVLRGDAPVGARAVRDADTDAADIDMPAIMDAAAVVQAVSRDDLARAVHDRHGGIAPGLREIARASAWMERRITARGQAVNVALEAGPDQIVDQLLEALRDVGRDGDRVCGRVDRHNPAAGMLDRSHRARRLSIVMVGGIGSMVAIVAGGVRYRACE